MSELMNHLEDLRFNQMGGRVDAFHLLPSIFAILKFPVCVEESNFKENCRVAREVRH